MAVKENNGYYKRLIHKREVFEKKFFGKIVCNVYDCRVEEESESSKIQEVIIHLNDGNYNFEMILDENRFYMRKVNWMLETEIMDNGKVILRYNGNHRFQFLKPEDQITLAETGELDITKYDELVELIEVSIRYV